MAIWPFRFKSSTKSSGNATADDVRPPVTPKEATLKRASSKRKQSFASPEDVTHRQSRSITFTAHPSGSTAAGKKKQQQQDGPPRPAAQTPSADPVPTLHHKRTGSDLTGRKSAQRTQEEIDREAEIKALSSYAFMSIRPVAYTGPLELPPKPIHRRVRLEEAEPAWGYPGSDVSLPIHSPMNSSLSLDSEFGSYKVSALDALAPRPTLKCVPPRRPASQASVPTRRGSQKRPLGDREPISEEILKAHKRVDDLADDLNASDLRELMERDDRRRERHRRSEREKLERKLSRRAERQRLREAEARMSGSPIPKNLERGVLGRELANLGMDPPSAVVVMSSSHKSSPHLSYSQNEESSSGLVRIVSKHAESSRFADVEHPQSRSLHTPIETPIEDMRPTSRFEGQDHTSKHSLQPRPAVRLEIEESMAKSVLDLDKEGTSPIYDEEASTRKDSSASNKTNHLSLLSLFKWGFRSRRNLESPSSFSNTSREEMRVNGSPQPGSRADTRSAPPTLIGNYISKRGLKAPKRGKSRFREDLPELPPNRESTRSPAAETDFLRSNMDTLDIAHKPSHCSLPVAISAARRSITPMAESHLAMSFASVDSEGSWLASRIGSLRSINREGGSLTRRTRTRKSSDGDLDNDDHQDPNDEIEPVNDNHNDEMDETFSTAELEFSALGSGVKYVGISNQPQQVQVFKPKRDTIQSREILLDIDSAEEEDAGADSLDSTELDEQADLQEARRLSMGPARRCSARSAKLFEVGIARHSMNENRET